MKVLPVSVFTLSAFYANLAHAHPGPTTAGHLLEHLVLALALGLPAILLLRHLLPRWLGQRKD